MTRFLVAGTGIAGTAAARALMKRGEEVVVYDRTRTEGLAALADEVTDVVTGDDVPAAVLRDVDEVVVSPGFPPTHPIALAAREAGLDVYSEPELAWRLRPRDAAPWLAVTGTNGKTTTVTMLASILAAAGLRSAALGNIGTALVDAVAADYDVLAVELSSQQLHWSSRLSPNVGALLNLADDHLSWHGGFDAYAHAKTAVWRGDVHVGNADDARVSALLDRRGGTAVTFTLGEPAPGQTGVRGDMLVECPHAAAPVELCPVATVRPAGSHNVANALAAVAVARSFGVSREAVARGLESYVPEPHRNVEIATVGGVRFVDDSKGTNPHATAAAIGAYRPIVWIAGGQLKGVDVEPLVIEAAPRLRGAVLMGVDRDILAGLLARHAPGVPVVSVSRTDPEAMSDVVAAAASLALPGDTVLLSPSGASYDMFSGYPDRGRRFAAAVSALDDEREPVT